MAVKLPSISSISDAALPASTGATILDMLPEILAIITSHLSISQSHRLLTTCKQFTESRYVAAIETKFRQELQGEADQFFSSINKSLRAPVVDLPLFVNDVRNAIRAFELLRARRTQVHISIIAFRMFSSRKLQEFIGSYFDLTLKKCQFNHFTNTFMKAFEISKTVKKLRATPASFSYSFNPDLPHYEQPDYQSTKSEWEVAKDLYDAEHIFEAAEIMMGEKSLKGSDVQKLISGFCKGGDVWMAMDLPEILSSDLHNWASEKLLCCLRVKGYSNLADKQAEGMDVKANCRSFERAYEECIKENKFDEAFSLALQIPDHQERKWKLDDFVNNLTSPLRKQPQLFSEAIAYTLKINDKEAQESCFKTITFWARKLGDSELMGKIAEAKKDSEKKL